MAKNFCVMTMGRTGSTSLVYAFRPWDDIVLPSRLFPDCEDEELIHPDDVADRRVLFAKMTGQALPDDSALIDAFYRHHSDAGYVGFKSMPQRHPDYERFIWRRDIFFITLTRRDLPSMVASFQLAHQHGTWRRSGEPVEHRWTFTRDKMPRVDGVLKYILSSNRLLSLIPDAVHLTYEDLCRPDFKHDALDDFFGRPIRISNPQGPTQASSYVENWDEFRRFIEMRTADHLGQPVFIV